MLTHHIQVKCTSCPKTLSFRADAPIPLNKLWELLRQKRWRRLINEQTYNLDEYCPDCNPGKQP